jgi:hypothetical protein
MKASQRLWQQRQAKRDPPGLATAIRADVSRRSTRARFWLVTHGPEIVTSLDTSTARWGSPTACVGVADIRVGSGAPPHPRVAAGRVGLTQTLQTNRQLAPQPVQVIDALSRPSLVDMLANLAGERLQPRHQSYQVPLESFGYRAGVFHESLRALANVAGAARHVQVPNP